METRVTINDMLTCVVYSDGSVDLFDLSGRVVALSNDDAYKVFATLQSLLFPNVPLIEHLNLG